MTFIDGLIIFLGILLAYFTLAILLNKLGILKKYNISFYGPMLLLRTVKGRGFLKRIARRKNFWKSYGNFGIILSFILMVILVIFFIWQVYWLSGIGLTPEQKQDLPGVEVALVLPGINPILPLNSIFYVIFALAVAIIVHEFSHGILTFAHDMKVKSLGLLYMIIPVGAFVEPDEEQLKKTQISKRMRVFAVGPLSNFVVAIVCLLLFSFVFIGSVQPIDGAEVLFSYQDTPADEINIPTGSVIISFNDTPIHNSQDFSEAIDKTSPNQTVNISYITDVDLEPIHAQVTLTSLYDVVSIRDDETINESTLKNTSFLGIRFNTYSKEFISSLKNPLTYKFPTGLANTFAIPIYGYIASYNPISEPYINTYKINGPLGFLPRGIFWGIVTALYWIFWLNLAVGLFNVLPITPLDGGFIFNDGIRAIVQRFKKDISEEKRDRIVRYISLIVSLSVLGLALFPFFFKYI